MHALGNLLHALSDTLTGHEKHHLDEIVDFSDKGLKVDNEEDAKPIVEALKNHPNMKVLKLYGNTFSPEGCKAIGKALESCSEFQRAHWKDMFTGKLKKEIPEALKYLSAGMMLANTKLVELDLSDNAFGPIGVEGIVVLLKSPVCYSLEELRLNNNGLGITGGKMLAEALNMLVTNAKNAGTPLKLKTFVCGRNRQENDGAKALATFLGSVGTLEEITMPQNGIYHEGLKALCEAFTKNPGLRIINVNDNTFTEKGAQHFAKAVEVLRQLESINLGDCLLRSSGAKIVAKALKAHVPKLKELILSSNEITADAAKAIVQSLRDKEITLVDLNGNCFGEKGCEEIQGLMEDLGLEDALLELDEDEGSEVEEETNGSLQLSEESSEEEEEITELKKPGDYVAIEPQQCAITDLLESPSLSKLLYWKGQGSDKIVEHLKQTYDIFPYTRESRYVQECVGVAMRLAGLLNPDSSQETKQLAIQVGVELLDAAFQKAREEHSVAILNNALVVYLGLLKSEDKKFRITWSLSGPMLLLENVVKQPYVPPNTKEVLKSFLTRDHAMIDSCPNEKQRLMRSLGL